MTDIALVRPAELVASIEGDAATEFSGLLPRARWSYTVTRPQEESGDSLLWFGGVWPGGTMPSDLFSISTSGGPGGRQHRGDTVLIAALDSSTRPTADHRDALTKLVARPVEDTATLASTGDRRLYALAAIERLRRLLGATQAEAAELVRVSRPTLWQWAHGRTPQAGTLRRVQEVATAVDVLADAFGREGVFSADRIQADLALGMSLITFLAQDTGPSQILDRLFAADRAVSRSREIPDWAEAVALGTLLDEEPHSIPDAVSGRPEAVRPVRRLGSLD